MQCTQSCQPFLASLYYRYRNSWLTNEELIDISVKLTSHFHEYMYGNNFWKTLTKCCNIYTKHQNKVNNGHLITLDMAIGFKMMILVLFLVGSCVALVKIFVKKNDTKDDDDKDDEGYNNSDEELKKTERFKERLLNIICIIILNWLFLLLEIMVLHNIVKSKQLAMNLRSFEIYNQIVANLFHTEQLNIFHSSSRVGIPSFLKENPPPPFLGTPSFWSEFKKLPPSF